MGRILTKTDASGDLEVIDGALAVSSGGASQALIDRYEHGIFAVQGIPVAISTEAVGAVLFGMLMRPAPNTRVAEILRITVQSIYPATPHASVGAVRFDRATGITDIADGTARQAVPLRDSAQTSQVEPIQDNLLAAGLTLTGTPVYSGSFAYVGVNDAAANSTWAEINYKDFPPVIQPGESLIARFADTSRAGQRFLINVIWGETDDVLGAVAGL